ncbi:hypothetical protein BCR35DRAFT_333869 [Leucosporidium creatinivorum]|uniref:Uncharacterized protein n=1 Tax=Leucosporidium creatinivorum TaxID=106004 RepID=A0A1Y2ENY5_9BASI|nr:hypothetical protein BCR35DRAFT_333869 [Leucosporidium creatinivorum]
MPTVPSQKTIYGAATLNKPPSSPSPAPAVKAPPPPPTPPPPPPLAARFLKADGTPLVTPLSFKEASTQTATLSEEAEPSRRPPLTFEPMSYADALECLGLSDTTDLQTIQETCEKAVGQLEATETESKRSYRIRGALLAIGQEHRSLQRPAAAVIQDEINAQLACIDVQPLAPALSSLRGLPGQPRSFDTVASKEDAWTELGVTVDSTSAETFDVPEAYKAEGAFITLCLFSANGLQPSDAMPYLIFNTALGDRFWPSSSSPGSEAPDSPSVSPKGKTTKKSKLKAKAAAKAEATEARLKRELASAKADLAVSMRREVQLQGSAAALRQRVSQLEQSVGSRQKIDQRVESEVQRRMEEVEEWRRTNASKVDELETRWAADRVELEALAGRATDATLKMEEHHSARVQQLEKERDEAREALQVAQQQQEQQKREDSPPPPAPTRPASSSNSTPSPSPKNSAFVIARLVARVEELSKQVVDKNLEITDLLLRLAKIEQ